MKNPRMARLPEGSEITKLRNQQDKEGAWVRIYDSQRLLLHIAAKTLPKEATVEDMEDCVSRFCMENLWDIVLKFDESKSRFSTYFTFCLKRFCKKEGKKIYERASREESINSSRVPTEDGEQIEMVIIDDRSENDVEQIVYAKELEAHIKQCAENLPRIYREILLLDGAKMSCNEIAASLGISPQAVRTRLFRARDILKQCLKNKDILL